MPGIIVIGSSTKSAAYTVKQLSRYGLHVTVYSWLDSPIKYSAYVNTYVKVTSPDADVEAFATNLINYLLAHNIDCLLPINDQALEICKLYYTQLSKYIKVIGVNDAETAKYAHSKYELIKVAQTVDIKTPETILITSLETLEQNKDRIVFPCIAKPASSSIIKDNRLYYFKVRRFNSYDVLLDYVRENINNVQILVQETIVGYGIGYNVIVRNGEVLNEYIHRRLFEYEGESTYRESVSVQEYNLQNKVHRLMKAINWNGVAMVEFRISASGAYIMEINGRFWGSIEVAIRSGLNYPVQLYQMQYLNQEITAGLPVKLVRVRNLKEEVVNTARAVAQQKSLSPFFKWIKTFKGALNRNEYIEDNIFEDPGFVLACYADVVIRNTKRVLDLIRVKNISVKAHQAIVPSSKPAVIAFACTGNICRSPFAECYARKFNLKHTYFSLGTVNAENRLGPVNAVKAAAGLGVNMDGFKSSTYDKTAIAKADYIFIMDRQNFFDLKELRVDESKIFFLGDTEIEDPYGKSLDEFTRIYRNIISSIEQKIPV